MPVFRRRNAQRSADAEPVPPLPRDIRVLIAAAFVIALGYGIVAPVLPQFASGFDVGVAAASMIVSVFAFARLVFAPAGGVMVGRWGERRVYITGLLIVAASTGACAFAETYWQLLLYRGLGGIGSTMFTISATALLLRLAPPDRRGRVSGAYAGSFLMGGILGPVAGGLLAGWGLRLPFLVYAAALLLAAAAVTVLLRSPAGADAGAASRGADAGSDAGSDSISAEGTAAGGAAGALPAAPPPPMSVKEALGDGAYRAALVSAFANGWATFGVRMSLIPLFTTAVLGAGPETAGLALAVFAGGNALALSFSGKLSDTVGRKPCMIAGLAITGLAIAGIGFTTSVPLFVAAAVIAGFGSGLLGPSQQAAVADILGSGRGGGKVLAVFQMSTDAGAIVGPLLAGLLADNVSYGWAFALTGAVAAAAALAWLPTRETLGRDDPSRAAPARSVD